MLSYLYSTFKFTCHAIPQDEQDAYEAKNKLVRILDRDMDEATHLPIERCLGVVVTGNV